MRKKSYILFLFILVFSFSCGIKSSKKNSEPKFFIYSGTEDPKGALFKNFFDVYTKGSIEEKKRSIGYFFGVAHATQDKIWCPIEGWDYYKEFDSWIYTSAKLDKSLKNKSSMEVITNFLKAKNPCTPISKKLIIKLKEIKPNGDLTDFLIATQLKEYFYHGNFFFSYNKKEISAYSIGIYSYVNGVVDATYNDKWCADIELKAKLKAITELRENYKELKEEDQPFFFSVLNFSNWQISYLSTWKKPNIEKQRILKLATAPAADVITEILAKNMPCKTSIKTELLDGYIIQTGSQPVFGDVLKTIKRSDY